MLTLLAVFIKRIWYFLKCVKSSLTYFMSPSQLPGAVLGAEAVKSPSPCPGRYSHVGEIDRWWDNPSSLLSGPGLRADSFWEVTSSVV